MNRTFWLAGTLLAAWVVTCPGTADAYPHFQITSGTTTCTTCHVSPSGGGLLTAWGRSEAGDTLSRGGDGSFLHGLAPLPEWLALQGEFRVAGLANHTGSPEGAELAIFPMQTDLITGLFFGQLSAVASVGYRGQVRDQELQGDDDAGAVDDQSALSFLISREHYLMWQSEGRGPYVRAGRFYAPYGLRVADHTSYIRRYLGTNILEEPYGVSGGVVETGWELHGSLFVGDPWRGTGRDELGGAVLYERRLGDHVVAAQSRLTVGDADVRALAGGYVKLWLESIDLLWMMEVDVGRQFFRDADGGDRFQLVTYTGPVYRPIQGLYIGLTHELYDVDLTVTDVTRQALGAWVSYLPWAHIEVMSSARAQLISPSDLAVVGLLQLHYYL